MKAILRKLRVRSLDALDTAIRFALNCAAADDCPGWFHARLLLTDKIAHEFNQDCHGPSCPSAGYRIWCHRHTMVPGAPFNKDELYQADGQEYEMR